MGSFVRLSSSTAVAAAPVAQSGGRDSGGLFLPEFSHAFDAVPAVPFAVRSTAAAAAPAAAGEEKAHMPAPYRTGTQAPTAVAANIRTLRRIRRMRAALRAKVRACVVSCRVVRRVCACAHTAPLVAIYTGVIDETIISTSDSLYVRFASDKSIVDKGFNASFSLIDQSTSSSSSSSSLSLVTHSTMR